MRATPPLRLHASAQVPPATRGEPQNRPPNEAATGQHVPALRPPAPPGRRESLLRGALSVLVLSVIWGGLTDWRIDALVFGVPAILLAAALPLLLSRGARWRLSPHGAIIFALWFAVQSVRGAVDVALRAFAPRMPLDPGFRSYALSLPEGAPRVMFINTITLLPGTLSADIIGDRVIIHMLDRRSDLDTALADLEARIRALFALPQDKEFHT
ncbi:MAG: cation transporter [Rhodobacteraceae bacterium]|nr:MAG: cation transporter [Paracoccaceae bacterium]